MGGRTGPVFYIYYEGMRHPPPILTRKKEFDLSKRKHGPTIVPALSVKVDNKKTIHSGWKRTAPLQAVPRTQHRQPVSLFLHGRGEQRKEEFHSSTKGRKKYGIAPSSLRKHINELEAARFIRVYSGKPTREPNRYEFCLSWKLPPSPLRSHTPMVICSKSVSDGNKGGP